MAKSCIGGLEHFEAFFPACCCLVGVLGNGRHQITLALRFNKLIHIVLVIAAALALEAVSSGKPHGAFDTILGGHAPAAAGSRLAPAVLSEVQEEAAAEDEPAEGGAHDSARVNDVQWF